MSAGGIRDRQYEHLGTADMAVAQMYRTLLKSAKQVAEGGKPIGYNLSVADLRGARTTLAVGTDRKSTRLNSSHSCATSMPSSACKKKTLHARNTKYKREIDIQKARTCDE